MYKENECRDRGEVSINGDEMDVVLQGLEKLSMRLAKNEIGSVNGEIKCLLLPECGKQ